MLELQRHSRVENDDCDSALSDMRSIDALVRMIHTLHKCHAVGMSTFAAYAS